MRIYAQTPAKRTSQLLGDATVLLWCVIWIWIGRRLHGLISQLAGPGRSVEQAGRDFAGSMADVSAKVGDIPVAGDTLQAPFDTARGVGDTLVAAGQAQQDVVGHIAFWLSLLIVVLPVGGVLLRRVPARIRWARQAAAAARMSGDLDLFALRAMGRLSLAELAAISPEPAAAWRAGHGPTIERLARAELDALGLRVPTARRAGP